MCDLILFDWLSDGVQRVSRGLEVIRLRQEVALLRRDNATPAEESATVTQDAIAACESFPVLMMRLWRLAWQSAGRGRWSSWNSSGESVRRLFDAAIRVMEGARARAEAEEALAGRPVGLERLDRALQEARRIRADLDTNWLWFTDEAQEEAKASIARGEGVDVEEAFAQMAGLTVDALREKVEAHKRKYHPNGGAVG